MIVYNVKRNNMYKKLSITYTLIYIYIYIQNIYVYLPLVCSVEYYNTFLLQITGLM